MKKVLSLVLVASSLQAMEITPSGETTDLLQLKDAAFMQRLVGVALKGLQAEEGSDFYQACRLAFEGRKKDAREAFMKAAADKCPRAQLFLSQDFAQGEFVALKHDGLALVYEDLAKKSIDSRDEQGNIEWLSLHDDVARCTKQLRTLNRARTDVSFRALLRELSRTDPDFFEPPLYSEHEVAQKVADMPKVQVFAVNR